jgi:multidrug transporter EmrE-like cation transporter
MKVKDIFQYCLAVVIVLVFFGVIWLLFSHSIPEENKDVTYLVTGAMVSVFTSVVNYFFSSTKGSAEKTEIIAKLPPLQENGFYNDKNK